MKISGKQGKDGKKNDMATKQGLLGLVAALKVIESENCGV